MKKNIAIPILSAISVVSIALAIYFYANSSVMLSADRHSTDKAFAEFTTSVSKLSTATEKAKFATSDEYTVTMLTEIALEAEKAKANLSDLRISETDLSKTQEFMSKISDYSQSLIKKIVSGQELTDEDRQNIAMFAENSKMLSSDVAEVQAMYNNGEIEDLYMNIKTFDGKEVQNVSGSFASSEETTDVNPDHKTQNFATLVYDGPFSAHISQREPAYLEGKEEISEEDAKKRVADFLGVDTSNVTSQGKMAGQIPCYKFMVEKDNKQIGVDMTITGGYILNTLIYREEVGNAEINTEDAIKKADEILKNSAFTDYKATYYTEANGILTINYAFTQGETVVYSDLIKMSIYLDDGTLKGVEASGYIMNHKEREMETPKLSIYEARQLVSSDLRILSEGMAIVPTSFDSEVLTYEFKCESYDGKHYLVYVDAINGGIENILILIEDETGTLTM